MNMSIYLSKALAERIGRDHEADRLKGALAPALGGVTVNTSVAVAQEEVMAKRRREAGHEDREQDRDQSATHEARAAGRKLGAAAGAAVAVATGNPKLAKLGAQLGEQVGEKVGEKVGQVADKLRLNRRGDGEREEGIWGPGLTVPQLSAMAAVSRHALRQGRNFIPSPVPR